VRPIEIPFNRPFSCGRELEYISASIASGHISGDGEFTRKCHRLIEQIVGVPKALLTTSCTDALEMAALLIDVQPGDEVIVPSFTFVSTINAFVLRGARPVFADIRPDTLNLDETQLECLIGPRTKVIVTVHYAGVGCEMDVISAIAARHGIAVVEDNAHGLFGQYRDRNLGTFGDLATLSFHETKNISCGEGGALLINDTSHIDRAEILREKGTNRSRFFRGQVDKYTWVDCGSSFLPSDLLSAFLFAQLEASYSIQAARCHIWEVYARSLAGWAAQREVRLPFVPAYCQQSYHMFYLLMPTMAERDALIDHLRDRGVMAVFHYQPLHLSEMGRRLSAGERHCPCAEDVSGRLVRLPFYNQLSHVEQSRVIEAVGEFRGRHRASHSS